MPSRAAIIANSIELGLVFAGLLLVWRLVLSPAARARRAATPSTLPAWDAAPSDFLMFLWVVVCGGILTQVLSTLLFTPLALSEDGKLIFANVALQMGELAGVALYYFGLKGGRLPRDFAPKKALLAGAATFVIAIPFVTIAGLGWQGLMLLCGLPVEKQEIIGRLANAESPALLAGMIALATFTAPIAEELIFRAGIFRYVRTRLPRWAALLLPACLFAALHLNLASFAQLIVLGIIFSLAYERTGRIGTAIVAHALFNAQSVVLVLIDPSAAN